MLFSPPVRCFCSPRPKLSTECQVQVQPYMLSYSRFESMLCWIHESKLLNDTIHNLRQNEEISSFSLNYLLHDCQLTYPFKIHTIIQTYPKK